MMIYPMVRENLEQQAKEGMKNETCESCGESWEAHLNTIDQSCHPGIGLLVGFHPNSGCLLLSCPACKQSFGMIQVAKEMDDIFEGMEHDQIIAIVIALSTKGDKGHPEPPLHPSRN